MPQGQEAFRAPLGALLKANPRSPLKEEDWSSDDVEDWGRITRTPDGHLTEL